MSVVILGKNYSNLAEAAKLNDIEVHTLGLRLRKYGNDFPLIFSKDIITHPLKVYDRWFPNFTAIAEYYDCKVRILIDRYHKYDGDWDQIFAHINDERTKRVEQNYKLVNNYLSSHGLISYIEAGYQLNLPSVFLKGIINRVNQHPESSFVPGLADYIVSINKQDPYFIRNNVVPNFIPKIALKKVALNKIKYYYRNIGEKSLVTIPFTNNRYFYDKVDSSVWSRARSDYILTRLVGFKRSNGTVMYNIRFTKTTRNTDISLHALQDMIAHPEITYKNIVTLQELNSSLGLEEDSYTLLRYRPDNIHLRIRVNPEGFAIRGYSPKDAKILTDRYYKGKSDIVIRGQRYSSWREAGRRFHNSSQTIKRRVEKFGSDSAMIDYDSNIRGINLLGHWYPSIRQAAKIHNMKPGILQSRITFHGNEWEGLFEPVRSSDLTLLGVKYDSLADAARQHNMAKSTLQKRIKNYGPNWSHLFDKRLPNRYAVTLCGVEYPSMTEAAKQHGLNIKQLSRRIKSLGHNDPHIFDPIKH